MWQWLLRPVTSVREGLKLFAFTLFACLAWSIFVSSVAHPLLKPDAGFDPTAIGWVVIPFLAATVLLEEIIRLLPLALVARFAGRGAVAVLGTAAVTAALFGAAHVTNNLPLWFVLICQGVTGFVMNLLYLKVGGLHRRMLKGFLFAFAFHLAFDLIIVVPVLLSKQP